MGATLITWQQLNILQNPLVNFEVKFNYNYSPSNFNFSRGPIERPVVEKLEKLRVELNKNSKSRNAENDMSS